MNKTARQLAREHIYRLRERRFAEPVIAEEIERTYKIPFSEARMLMRHTTGRVKNKTHRKAATDAQDETYTYTRSASNQGDSANQETS